MCICLYLSIGVSGFMYFNSFWGDYCIIRGGVIIDVYDEIDYLENVKIFIIMFVRKIYILLNSINLKLGLCFYKDINYLKIYVYDIFYFFKCGENKILLGRVDIYLSVNFEVNVIIV